MPLSKTKLDCGQIRKMTQESAKLWKSDVTAIRKILGFGTEVSAWQEIVANSNTSIGAACSDCVAQPKVHFAAAPP